MKQDPDLEQGLRVGQEEGFGTRSNMNHDWAHGLRGGQKAGSGQGL
jgi:hypothetical protein